MRTPLDREGRTGLRVAWYAWERSRSGAEDTPTPDGRQPEAVESRSGPTNVSGAGPLGLARAPGLQATSPRISWSGGSGLAPNVENVIRRIPPITEILPSIIILSNTSTGHAEGAVSTRETLLPPFYDVACPPCLRATVALSSLKSFSAPRG